MRRIARALAAAAALSISVPAQATTIISEDFESGFGVFTPSGPVGIYTGTDYESCCFVFGSPEAMANHFVAFNGGGQSNGMISTTFLTLPGATYTLTFDYSSLGDGYDSLWVNIYTLDTNMQVDNPIPGGNNWLDVAFSGYTATFGNPLGGLVHLEIGSGGATDADGVLDNLVLTGPVIEGVPEPGTWAMMLLGFGATGFRMRRRHQIA